MGYLLASASCIWEARLTGLGKSAQMNSEGCTLTVL